MFRLQRCFLCANWRGALWFVWLYITLIAVSYISGCSEEDDEEELLERFRERNRREDPDFGRQYIIIDSPISIDLLFNSYKRTSAKLYTTIDDRYVLIMAFHSRIGYHITYFPKKIDLNEFIASLENCAEWVRWYDKDEREEYSRGRTFYEYKTLDDPGGMRIEGMQRSTDDEDIAYDSGVCLIAMMDFREKTPEAREVVEVIIDSPRARVLAGDLREARDKLYD